MAIGIEQLNLNSVNSQFATDAELQNLVGVAQSTILSKLGVLTTEQQASIGVIQYTHPATHSANMIEETPTRRFVTNAQVERLEDTFTASEVRNLVSSIVLGLNWRERVDTYAQLATRYPNPEDGIAVHVKERNSVFRFNANIGGWEDIMFTILPTVTSEVEGLMTPVMYNKLASIEAGANNYVHPENHSADMIIPGNTNTVFTHEDKARLDQVVKTEGYVHPETHPASMITTDPNRRFVSDVQLMELRNKYTKEEVDNKVSMLVSGQIPKPSVRDLDQLYSKYPNPEKGWVVEIETLGIKKYFNGTVWETIGTTVIPMASEVQAGKMSPEDFKKLASIEAGASKHKEGDGFLHLPLMGNANYKKLLASGTIGNQEQHIFDFKNLVSNNGTTAMDYSFTVINTNVSANSPSPTLTVNGTIEIKVTKSMNLADVARAYQLKLAADTRFTAYFTANINPENTQQLLFRSIQKYPHNLKLVFRNVSSQVSTDLVVNQHGLSPVEERFSITFTSGATGNGVVTLYLNNNEHIVNIHVATNDSASAIAYKMRNAILSTTPYHVDPINQSYPNTIVVTAPEAANIVDASLVQSNGVTSQVYVDRQGQAGRSERVTLSVLSPSSAFGTLGVYFNDGSFEKTFTVLVDNGDQPASIATKIRNELIAHPVISEYYTLVTPLDRPNTVIITRKSKEDINLRIIVTDVFSGIGTIFTKTAEGISVVDPYWIEPLTIGGKTSGNVGKNEIQQALENPKLLSQVSEVYNWKGMFDDYLNLSAGRELIDMLNDIFDSYRNGTLGGLIQTSGKYAGYSSVTVINHPFELGTYSVNIVSTENPNGRLGEVWVEKKNRYVNVYNTGSFKGSFDISFQPYNKK